jgi:hypothetical protein
MGDERPDDVNVFGAGAGSITRRGVGGIGLSGDTSCADHNAPRGFATR